MRRKICFVIQPFDHGWYDSLYVSTFLPAIAEAGLAPYRVDKDHSSVDLLDSIEAAIRRSRVCLAEVTEWNPNVWLELGYAIACGKPAVLVAERRPGWRPPFDIASRPVIFYDSREERDIEPLRTLITVRLVAMQQSRARVAIPDRPRWPEPTSIAEARALVRLGDAQAKVGKFAAALTAMKAALNSSRYVESPRLVAALQRSIAQVYLRQAMARDLAVSRKHGEAMYSDIVTMHVSRPWREGLGHLVTALLLFRSTRTTSEQMRTLYILTAARNRMNYRPDIFVAVCVSRGMQESDAQQLFDALRESHIKG